MKRKYHSIDFPPGSELNIRGITLDLIPGTTIYNGTLGIIAICIEVIEERTRWVEFSTKDATVDTWIFENLRHFRILRSDRFYITHDSMLHNIW
jgi:hypothetical protein